MSDFNNRLTRARKRVHALIDSWCAREHENTAVQVKAALASLDALEVHQRRSAATKRGWVTRRTKGRTP